MQIEICCNSITSAIEAKRGGARRVELCQDLAGGGTTPSAAAIEYCAKELALETRVLIRPHTGDFVYSKEEYDIILRDIVWAKQLDAHAVVVGFLTADGDIDVERTREAVQVATPMEVTFHRAFDECRNPEAALETLVACGCHKLLTSGCAPSAWEGRDRLRQLVTQSFGRIAIIAAAGVVAANARQIVDYTGVTEIHGSCKRVVDGVVTTDGDEVRRMIAAVTETR